MTDESDMADQLLEQVVEWIRTPDWNASRAYLKAHSAILLTEEAERILGLLYNAQTTEQAQTGIAEHQRLLHEARSRGIDAAYNAFMEEKQVAGDEFHTEDAELEGLLAELWRLARGHIEPPYQEELARRILQIDAQTHALTSAIRGAVLGIRGNALLEIAKWVGGSDRIALLHEAIACYDDALLEYRREVDAAKWATTHTNKGNALSMLAENLHGTERTQTLEAALANYDNALLEYRREVAPLQWAATHNNKGNALRTLAASLNGAKQVETLHAAIASFDQALLERQREVVPFDWAGTHNNKGNALRDIAENLHGTERTQTLEAALANYDNALLEYRREVAPLQWAATLTNKGKSLDELSQSLSGAEWEQALRDAVACFDQALLEYRREVAPRQWATALNNKGNTLVNLAEGLGSLERVEMLKAAVTCFDQSLLERQRETVPMEWAATLNNKGNALLHLAQSSNGAERVQMLRMATACYDDALLEYRREVAPRQWATTLTNKGNTLATQAEGLRALERVQTLEKAIACYDDALLERRREVVPMEWAATHVNEGNVLLTLAESLRETRQSVLQVAIDHYNDALTEYHREVVPLLWAGTCNNKGNALRLVATYLQGTEQAHTLEAAIACYNDALLERRQEVTPLDWAATQNNTGNALSELAECLDGVAREPYLLGSAAAFRAALNCFLPEVQPGDHRRVARALSGIYLRLSNYAEKTSSEEKGKIWLEDAWQVASSAIVAADLLELQAPSLSFRQQEWGENASLYNVAGCVQARRGRLGEAVALIERGRGRGLAEAAGRRNADLSSLTDEDRDDYLSAVTAVQAIEARGRQGGDPLALVAEARAANGRLAAVVTRLRAVYPDFLPEQRVSISALAAALQPGEALTYLVSDIAGTLILTIPQRGEPRMKWLADLTSAEIQQLTVRSDSQNEHETGFLPAALGWLRRDRDALARALDELLPQLGDRLMRHVVELAREVSCQRIVLVPSGYLSVLPLHAASYAPLAGEPETAPEGRRYACDDLAITYAPSGLTLLDARRTARRQRRDRKARRLFIAGNPQLTPKDQPWSPLNRGYLRYAEWEANRVGEIAMRRTAPLDVDLALNEQATWMRVVEGLGEADAAHLALHATFNFDDPQQSAFLVAFQAKLLLRDLLDPRLVNLTRLRLVILSACQSALSDVSHQSEEAVGLFGALLAGGVPEVIGTLWSVNDLAAAALMESFARRYLIQGRTAGDALREATRDLRGISDAPDAPNAPRPAMSPTAAPAVSTPALRRWHELSERDPEAEDATRLLDDQGLADAGETVHRFAAGQSKRPIPRDHPVYWAAFVFHGASLPLDSDIPAAPAEPAESADDLIAAPVHPFAPPQSALPSDEPRDAENRTADYFPAAEGVCPRCYAQDFVARRDDLGREVRQCVSCQQVYRMSAPMPDLPR